MGSRPRLIVWMILAGGIPLATLGWLWQIRGARILDNDAWLIGGWVGISTLLLAMLALLRSTPHDAIRLPENVSRITLVGGSVVMHLAALWLLWPALSEDATRYRLDGRMWLGGASPYAVTPRHFFAEHPPDAIDRATPFPYMHTIYPPVAQTAFVAAARVEPLFSPPPAGYGDWRALLPQLAASQRVLCLRVIFAAASVVCGVVLLGILKRTGRSPWHAALAAWNPLLIVESAGMGHVDALGLLFMLLALLMILRGRYILAGIGIALACGVKPVAIVLVPFLWRQGRTSLLLGFLPAITIIAAPMILQRGWIDSARSLSQRWEANGSAYELIKHLFGQGDEGMNMERTKSAARWLALLAALGVAFVAWWRRATAADAGYALLLTLLLLGPLVYPWYLIWIIGLVPLVRPPLGWTGMVMAAAVCVSHTLWHQPVWQLPGRTLVLEYAPVYLVLIVEAIRSISGRFRPAT